MIFSKKSLEMTKGFIRNCISKKDRQYNDHKIKDKKTYKGLQNIT